MRVFPSLVIIVCLYTSHLTLPHLSAQSTPRASTLSNGATQANSDRASIQATLGQPLIGLSASTTLSANHGVWLTTPNDKVNSSGSTLHTTTTLNYALSPNPVVSSAQLRFNPNCRTNLNAELFALNGKFIRSENIEVASVSGSASGSANEQQTLLTLDATNLASGVYSLRIHSDCDNVSIPIIISK